MHGLSSVDPSCCIYCFWKTRRALSHIPLTEGLRLAGSCSEALVQVHLEVQMRKLFKSTWGGREWVHRSHSPLSLCSPCMIVLVWSVSLCMYKAGQSEEAVRFAEDLLMNEDPDPEVGEGALSGMFTELLTEIENKGSDPNKGSDHESRSVPLTFIRGSGSGIQFICVLPHLFSSK